MFEDFSNIEFICIIVLFIVVMNEIIIFYLVNLLLNWESCGLLSFYLIAFWFNSYQVISSSIQSLFIGSFSDVLILIVLVFLFCYNIVVFNLIMFIYLFDISQIILLVLFSGSMNTVFIFIHIWLPNAMEGPTPVSSLLHSATLVTLGLILWFLFICFLEVSINIIFIVFNILSIYYYNSVILFILDMNTYCFLN